MKHQKVLRSTLQVLCSILVLFVIFTLPRSVFAANGIAKVINFQGKVTNATGTNVADGTYDFVIKIYDGASSGASTLFTETWSTGSLWSSTMSSAPTSGGESLTYSSDTNESTIKVGQILWNTTKKESVVVTSVNTGTNVIGISPTRQAWAGSDTVTNKLYVKDGVFKVAINSLNSDLSGVNFNTDQIFMGVEFNSDGEMKPRIQYTATPYAFNAEKVNGLTVTNTSDNPFGSTTILKIGDGKTVQIDNGLRFTGTDGTQFNFPTGSGTVVTADSTAVLTNKSIGSGGLTFAGATTDITTGTNENLVITPNGTGRVGIGTTNPLGWLDIRSMNGTIPAASVSANTSFASLLVDNMLGDLFTASASGQERFTITNSGALRLNGSIGTSNQCLLGGSTATWGTCTGAPNFWQLAPLGGAVSPITDGTDVLFGGTSSASAKFAFLNNLTGSPTASIASNLSIVVPTGSTPSTQLNILNGGSFDIRTSAGGDAGSSRLFVANNGNVGVGTTDPSRGKVDILASGTVTALNINSILNLPTTGTGINAYVPSLTTGKGIELGGTAAGGINNFSGNYLIIDPRRALGTSGVTRSDSGSFVNLDRTNYSVSSASTFNLTGAMLNIASNCTVSNGGVCTDSSSLINLDQQFASASGTVLSLSNSGLGIGQYINSNSGGQAAFIVNKSQGVGDIFSASSSGATKFTIANNGNLTATGMLTGLTGLTLASGGINVGGSVGTSADCLKGGASASWGSCGSAGTSYFQLAPNGGAVSPIIDNYDVLVGSTATSSALIRLAGTAGQASFFTGNVGIGVTNPNNKLQVLDYLNFDASTSGTFLGFRTGYANESIGSVFVGYEAGFRNTTVPNTAVGYQALRATTGGLNSAFGYNSLKGNTTGSNNNAFGHQSLLNNTTGSSNNAFGQLALWNNGSGNGNNAFGFQALRNNSSGSYNSAFGYQAGYTNNGQYYNNDGNNNTYFGYNSGPWTANASFNNSTAIGAYALVNASNSLVLGGTADYAVNVGIGTATPSAALDIQGGQLGGRAALILNQTGANTNDIFTASSAGTTKFTIANNGNLSATGTLTGLTGLTLASGGINLGGTVGSSSQCLLGGSTATWGTCTGAPNLWQNANAGAISPFTDGTDVLFGGTSSSSAKFAFLNNLTGSPTASIASNLSLVVPTGANPATQLNVLNGGSFDIRTSAGGDAGTSRLFVANNGNIGIGTTSPINGKVNITASSGTTLFLSTSVSTGTLLNLNDTGWQTGRGISVTGTVATGISNSGGYIVMDPVYRNNTSGSTKIDSSNFIKLARSVLTTSTASTINLTGDVLAISSGCTVTGVGVCTDSSSLISLDQQLASASGTVLKLSNSGLGIGQYIDSNSGGQAAFIINKSQGVGDIFSASSSGTPKFTIANNGNLTATGTLTGLTGLTLASGGINVGGTVGTSADCLKGGASASWGLCGSAVATYWQLAPLGGAVSPSIDNYDVLVGSTATSSALIRLAGTSGQSSFFSGNVGIGLTNPNNKLQVLDYLNFDATTSGTFLGYRTGYANSRGGNVFIGYESGFNNSTGLNTAVGYQALRVNTTGDLNSAFGYQSLEKAIGTNNSAFGYQSLRNTSGNDNSAFGIQALLSNSTGFNNTAIGAASLSTNNTGINNTALGASSLYSNFSGSNNVALGFQAGYGVASGYANTSGSNNIFIGYNSGPYSATQRNNMTAIGAFAVVDQVNSLVLGGVSNSDYAVNVGIGTATPSATLDIQGGQRGGRAALIVNQLGSSSNDIFTASASGTTRFVIQNNGNVGIGTTSTAGKLSFGTLSGTGIWMGPSALTSGTAFTMAGGSQASAFNSTATYFDISPVRGVSASSTVSNDGTTFINVDRTNTVAVANTYNNTGSLVNISANCLVSNGGVCTDSSTLLNLNQQYASASGTVLTLTNSGLGIGQLINSNSGGKAAFIVNKTQGVGDIFSASSSGLPKFTINNSGSASMSGGLTFGDGTGANNYLRTAFGPLNLQYKSGANTWANALTIQDVTGNVGIGTTNPTQPLSVNGNANIAGGLTGLTGLTLASGSITLGGSTGSGQCLLGGSTATWGACAAGGASYFQLSPTGGAVSPTISNYDVLVGSTATSSALIRLAGTAGQSSFFNGGNVGVGTSAPAAELHVTRPLSFGATGKALAIFDQIENQDIFSASAAGVAKFTVSKTGSATMSGGLTFGDGTAANNTLKTPFGPLVLQYKSGANAWSNGLYLQDTSGNVGIGTTNPAGKLEVAGNTIVFGDGEGSNPHATTIRGAAAGGADVAGTNLTFDASNGTGSGGSGAFIFRTSSGLAGTVLAPTYDTSSASSGTSTTSISWSHTMASGSNKAIFVGVSIRQEGALKPVVSSVTFNGTENFTLVGAVPNDGKSSVEIWRLLNPTSTTANIVVTLDHTATEVEGGATSWTGVNQTTPNGTFASNNGNDITPTVNVSSATNEVVIDTAASVGVFTTPGAGQTQRWNVSINGNGNGAGSTEAGSSTTTMSWTLNGIQQWVIGGVSIKGVPASGSTTDVLTERFRIDPSGNIGIGTTAPTSLLSVNGAKTGKALSVFNETGDQALFTASASGATKFVIDHSGNVGIGTTAPIGNLDISNIGKASLVFNPDSDQNGGAGENGYIKFNTGDGPESYVIGTSNETDKDSEGNTFTGALDGLNFHSLNGGALQFGTGSNVGMSLNYLNNLGIGNTTPSSALFVTRPLSFGANGSALGIFNQIENQDILSASAAGVTKFTVNRTGSASMSGGLTFGDGTAANNTLKTPYGPLVLQYKSAANAWSNGLYLQDVTGNIGVGTNSPAYKFDVNGTGNFGDTLTVSNKGLEFTESDTNPTCSSGNYSIYADLSETMLKKCVNGVVTDLQEQPDVVTAQNTNNVTWADNDTTDLWATLSELQIGVPVGGEVLVLSHFVTTAVDPGAAQVELGARIDREGAGVASDCADVNTVGTPMHGGNDDDATADPAFSITGTTAFVDTGTSAGGTFTYAVCTDAATTTIGGGTWVMDTMELTLMNVNDAGDLAEIYPTSDSTLQAGEVVSIDPKGVIGITRSAKAYDDQAMGVIATKPALVMGSREGEGVDGKPVALSGRVPVKVTTENGPIKKGDVLTTSSTPGAAMKATKSGKILGMAMGDYAGDGVGTILVFVKTGYYNGSNLKDILSIPTDSKLSQEEIGKMALSHFIKQKESYAEGVDLSEILADRVVAGLEVVTPRVVTQDVSLTTLSISDGSALTVELGEDGQMKLAGLGNESVIVFDAQGNATFAGTVTAKKIKADQIEGLELIVDHLINKSASDSASASMSAMFADVMGISTGPSDASSAASLLSPTFDLDSLTDGGVATVSGELRVRGNSVFEGMVSVVDDFTAHNIFITGISNFLDKVVFHNDVLFKGHVTVSQDTAGTATIKKGQNTVEVKFEKAYESTPVVNLNLSSEDAKSAKRLFGAGYQYVVTEKTENDFTIVLNKAAGEDLKFSWSALAPSND